MMRVAALIVLASWAPPAFAQESGGQGAAQAAEERAAARASDNYDELYARYLRQARTVAETPATPDSQWMSGLFGDTRARRVNDLVTVRVLESVTGAGTADSNLDKSSRVAAGLPNLFGLESKYPGAIDPSSLVSGSANTTFKGGGATSRTGELSAIITARVAEVLPNGDLALEGVREIDINGDRQIIVLTGVIRPADIGPGNVVPSTHIGQMRIRYFGRGLIKDNLKPGWLVRVLNKIF